MCICTSSSTLYLLRHRAMMISLHVYPFDLLSTVFLQQFFHFLPGSFTPLKLELGGGKEVLCRLSWGEKQLVSTQHQKHTTFITRFMKSLMTGWLGHLVWWASTTSRIVFCAWRAEDCLEILLPIIEDFLMFGFSAIIPWNTKWNLNFLAPQ